jgi:hypothetical protein
MHDLFLSALYVGRLRVTHNSAARESAGPIFGPGHHGLASQAALHGLSTDLYSNGTTGSFASINKR